MIYDKLTNITKYLGCNPNLDIAIRYITSHNLSELPLGRTELSGSEVFINVMEATVVPIEKQNFEIHKNYMDIQIDLVGTEMIQIGDDSDMTVEDYNPKTDFGVARCRTLTSCIMGPGNFIICMSGEPHKPGIAVTEEYSLKKCVFKIHTQ